MSKMPLAQRSEAAIDFACPVKVDGWSGLSRLATADVSEEYAFVVWRGAYGSLHDVALPRRELSTFQAEAVQ